MHSVTDSAGRVWSLAINVGSIRKVQTEYKVYLPSLLEGKMDGLASLIGDVVAFSDVAYSLMVSPPASKVEFESSLSGDSVEQFVDAFLGELRDFFRTPQQRQAIDTLLRKLKDVENLASQQAMDALDALDPAVLLEQLKTRSGVAQAS